MSTCGIFTYLVLYLDEVKLKVAARFFTVTAFAIILTRVFGGRIHDKCGHLFIVAPSSSLLILSEVVLLVWPGPVTVLFAAACFGLGLGALLPSLQALAISFAPPEKRTAAAAAFLNGYDVGQASGIVLLGVLSELADSYRWVYLATPLFMGALLSFYLASSLFSRGKVIKAG